MSEEKKVSPTRKVKMADSEDADDPEQSKLTHSYF